MAENKESKVKPEQYITIQGWMLTELELKGNELLIYACIYGFSQADGQVFNGSLQYLADWTNSTKQGVLRALKNLTDKGLVVKTDKVINGVKFCEYNATKFNGVLNKVDNGIKQSLTGGIQQSLTNNIAKDTLVNNIEYIVEYLNQKAGTNYRANTKATKQHINARLAEGFTVEDCKRVIDIKTAEWLHTKMEQYLRPQTLFGSKFESYLNSKAKRAVAPKKASDLDGVF